MGYFGALALLPLGTWAAGATAPMFCVDAWVLTALWYRSFRRFEASPSNATARAFFLWSIPYLGAMFGAIVLHSAMSENDWRASLRERLRETCVHATVSDSMAVRGACPVEPIE